MDKTATGIEADTVIPTFKAKYKDEAPNRIPKKTPIKMGPRVSSANFSEDGIKGLNFDINS
jgi:hypothetical protein